MVSEHRLRSLLLAMSVVIALANISCGTRVADPPPAHAAARTSTASVPGRSASPIEAVGDAGRAPSATLPAASGAPAKSSQALHSPGRSGAPDTPAAPKSTSNAPARALGPPPGSEPGGNASPGMTKPTEPAPVGGGPAAERPPVKLGHVNTLSGPAASSLAPVLQGVQLWAKWVNDHGGIVGHKVRVLASDDGGDPARHKQLVQELVERQQVLAFIANSDALSGPSAVDYLNQKRIPVVGVAGAEAGWQYQSPMYFPQASSGPPYIQAFFASAVRQLNARGKHKLAVISCGEVQACRDVNDQAEAQTRGRDVEIVYKARVALAQPDFTAECLSASNAGAEGVVLALDSNGTRRVSGSCARQGYRPMYSIPIQNVADDMKDDPNLKTTLTAAASTFIYTQASTPATAEYQEAKLRFGGGLRPSGGLSTGWVAGKLFEKATASVTEVSTREILAGLWRIKGDDLGGLTQPLTFTENRSAEPGVCWFDMAVVNDIWTSPDDFRRICEPFRH